MGLEIVELVMAVEDHFRVQIDDREAGKMVTCGMLCDHVAGKLRARGDTREVELIWQELKQVIIDQLGVKSDEVTREARFVEDLRAD